MDNLYTHCILILVCMYTVYTVSPSFNDLLQMEAVKRSTAPCPTCGRGGKAASGKLYPTVWR